MLLTLHIFCLPKSAVTLEMMTSLERKNAVATSTAMIVHLPAIMMRSRRISMMLRRRFAMGVLHLLK